MRFKEWFGVVFAAFSTATGSIVIVVTTITTVTTVTAIRVIILVCVVQSRLCHRWTTVVVGPKGTLGRCATHESEHVLFLFLHRSILFFFGLFLNVLGISICCDTFLPFSLNLFGRHGVFDNNFARLPVRIV